MRAGCCVTRDDGPGPGQSLAYDSYTATDDKLVLFDDEKVVTLTLQ